MGLTAILLLTGKTVRGTDQRGEFSRSISGRELFEGDVLRISYKLMFPDSRPRLVEVVQDLPEGFGSGYAREVRMISGEAELELVLTASSRGRFRLPPCRLAETDAAGITVQHHSFGGEEELLVSSRVQRIDVEAIQPLHPKTLTGNRISRFRGGGSEFYSMRKYIEGESIRRVNWRASAKSVDLWVNEFLGESSGTQIIIIDARMIEEDRRITKEMADVSIRAASSIAYSSLNERNAVGMFIISDTVKIVRPDYGIRQFIRIGEALKNVGLPAFRSVANLQKMARVYGDGKAQYVVISPLSDNETLDSVAELALSHEDVLVLVPLVAAPGRAESPAEMAVAVTRLRQETNAIILSQLCRTLTWQRDDELSIAIGRAGMLQMRRRM